jgi:peptide-methionine (S)-S-oxide reductase
MKAQNNWRRALLGVAMAGVIGQCSAFSFGAEDAVAIPPPALDETTQAHS